MEWINDVIKQFENKYRVDGDFEMIHTEPFSPDWAIMDEKKIAQFIRETLTSAYERGLSDGRTQAVMEQTTNDNYSYSLSGGSVEEK